MISSYIWSLNTTQRKSHSVSRCKDVRHRAVNGRITLILSKMEVWHENTAHHVIQAVFGKRTVLSEPYQVSTEVRLSVWASRLGHWTRHILERCQLSRGVTSVGALCHTMSRPPSMDGRPE